MKKASKAKQTARLFCLGRLLQKGKTRSAFISALTTTDVKAERFACGERRVCQKKRRRPTVRESFSPQEIRYLKLLRKQSASVPIIVFTIDESQTVADTFLAAGASDFALKPIKAPDIVSRIRLHLRFAGQNRPEPALSKGISGGTLDIIMMRLLEIINGIPYLIIVILLMMILRPGMMTIIIAYSLVGWIPMARLVRGQVVALKQQEYIAAAEAMGAGPARIIARHLLPNTLSVVIVRVTLSIPSAIFSEAYLSYIGLGIPLPMCSWGSLAQLGIENFRIYPYQLIIPAICISLTMLAFNMFGDGLRDAFDQRLRR